MDGNKMLFQVKNIASIGVIPMYSECILSVTTIGGNEYLTKKGDCELMNNKFEEIKKCIDERWIVCHVDSLLKTLS